MIDFNKREVFTVDNFIPELYQDFLYEKYTYRSWWRLEGLNIPTSYKNIDDQNRLIDPNNPIKNNIEESYQFSFGSYDGPQNVFENEDLNPFHLIHYLQIQTNFQYIFSPIRCKINFQPFNSNFKKTSHNSPHVDYDTFDFKRWTMIYYINDSDGDTLIFNETWEGVPIKNFTIDKKISPKRGRAVIFPGDRFHCGTTPIISKARIVANINFTLN